jgi:quinol monooxygenase YgiN
VAGFVQIIEFTTSRIDEVEKLGAEFRERRSAEAQEGLTVRRVTMTADRDRPNTYLNIVEFESYDAAMENSKHPETTAFASKMQELCDGPPRFYNLDIVDSWEV